MGAGLWQVKNFGRAGQTKYTHLLDQDTSKVRGKGGRGAAEKGRGAGTAEGSGCWDCCGVGAAGRGQVRGREGSGPQGGR